MRWCNGNGHAPNDCRGGARPHVVCIGSKAMSLHVMIGMAALVRTRWLNGEGHAHRDWHGGAGPRIPIICIGSIVMAMATAAVGMAGLLQIL